MQLSHKYELESMELKQKIAENKKRLTELSSIQQNSNNFILAVRKFMEMETLTPELLKELVERIDAFETEGTVKNRSQRIVIHYRFVGYVEIPEQSLCKNYIADTRQGVAVEYIPKASNA